MARARDFDTEKVSRILMTVFWERGYADTSIADLEKATALVRTSLYNGFGNKAEMFALCLRLYSAQMEAMIDQVTEGRGVEALIEVLTAVMTGPNRPVRDPAGCLMVGAATQVAALEPVHLEIVRAYRAMLARKAREALERDRSEGRLRPEIAVEDAAELLVCMVWGALASQCIRDASRHQGNGLSALGPTLRSWIRQT